MVYPVTMVLGGIVTFLVFFAIIGLGYTRRQEKDDFESWLRRRYLLCGWAGFCAVFIGHLLGVRFRPGFGEDLGNDILKAVVDAVFGGLALGALALILTRKSHTRDGDGQP